MTSITGQAAVLALFERIMLETIRGNGSELAGLEELSDCTFQVNVTKPDFAAYLIIDSAARPRLQTVFNGKVTTKVSGSGSDFIALLMAEDPGSEIINSPLKIEGSSTHLLRLQKLIKGIDLDWEAILIESLGDILGHQLANFLRSTQRWNNLARDSISRQITEFIHEEARISPPHLEIENFYRDIQNFNLTLDRLNFRLAKLKRRI